MAQGEQRVAWETTFGDTVTAGDVSATPQSQALRVRCPFGGWVWNRPVGVLVERDGEEEYVPVVDLTRLVQLSLYGIGLVCAVLGLVVWVRERRGSSG